MYMLVQEFCHVRLSLIKKKWNVTLHSVLEHFKALLSELV